MSGPIVRKYGFPNFDEIFGKKELQHGVDDPATKDANAVDKDPKPASKDEKPTETPRST